MIPIFFHKRWSITRGSSAHQATLIPYAVLSKMGPQDLTSFRLHFSQHQSGPQCPVVPVLTAVNTRSTDNNF